MKSALGKALYYLREQRTYLERYLLDGRLESTNNRAERSSSASAEELLFCDAARVYAYVNSIPKGKTILAQWHERRVIPALVLRLCQIKITGANRVWTA